jgi:hypothetical protein
VHAANVPSPACTNLGALMLDSFEPRNAYGPIIWQALSTTWSVGTPAYAQADSPSSTTVFAIDDNLNRVQNIKASSPTWESFGALIDWSQAEPYSARGSNLVAFGRLRVVADPIGKYEGSVLP